MLGQCSVISKVSSRTSESFGSFFFHAVTESTNHSSKKLLSCRKKKRKKNPAGGLKFKMEGKKRSSAILLEVTQCACGTLQTAPDL